jgi:hypothetical protein
MKPQTAVVLLELLCSAGFVTGLVCIIIEARKHVKYMKQFNHDAVKSAGGDTKLGMIRNELGGLDSSYALIIANQIKDYITVEEEEKKKLMKERLRVASFE